MSTYLNAYEILKQVRLAMHEYSEDLTQGVESDEAFNNDYLMQKINNAQRYVYNILIQKVPDWFITSTTADFSSSSYTLPWDFGKIHELRDENGQTVHHLKAKQSKLVDQTGDDSYYYQQGNALKLDKSGVTKNYTLWYYTKPREIHSGRITASGSSTITLDSSAKKVADYYNNMTIENVSSDWVDTVDDYTAARVATISETDLEIDDDYGFVSELPEPFHFLIPLKALLDIKLEHPLSKGMTNQVELAIFNDQLWATMTAFADMNEDISISEIFNDYLPYSSGRTVILDA